MAEKILSKALRYVLHVSLILLLLLVLFVRLVGPLSLRCVCRDFPTSTRIRQSCAEVYQLKGQIDNARIIFRDGAKFAEQFGDAGFLQVSRVRMIMAIFIFMAIVTAMIMANRCLPYLQYLFACLYCELLLCTPDLGDIRGALPQVQGILPEEARPLGGRRRDRVRIQQRSVRGVRELHPQHLQASDRLQQVPLGQLDRVGEVRRKARESRYVDG